MTVITIFLLLVLSVLLLYSSNAFHCSGVGAMCSMSRFNRQQVHQQQLSERRRLLSRIFLHYNRKQAVFVEQVDTTKLNEDIDYPEVRVIIPSSQPDVDQVILGVISIEDALMEARNREMDLVMVNEDAHPPVCRIVNYSKYRYNQEKRTREQQRKQLKSKSSIKEIKLSYKIDTHDVEFKRKAARGFLENGDRVRVVLTLRGREMQYQNDSAHIVTDFAAPLLAGAVTDGEPRLDGRQWSITLAPKKLDKKLVVATAAKSFPPPLPPPLLSLSSREEIAPHEELSVLIDDSDSPPYSQPDEVMDLRVDEHQNCLCG